MIYIFVTIFYYAKKVISKNCPEWIKAMCSLLLREEQIWLNKCSDNLEKLHQQQILLLTLNGVTPQQFLELLYTFGLEDTEVEDISGEFIEKNAADILVSLSINYNVLL